MLKFFPNRQPQRPASPTPPPAAAPAPTPPPPAEPAYEDVEDYDDDEAEEGPAPAHLVPEEKPAPVVVAAARPAPVTPILPAPSPKPITTKPQPPTAPVMPENPNKNILSKDVEIKGNIRFTNELIIDGKIEGEIFSEGVLTVGENADIRGEVKTKSVTVLGKVVGNITVTERAELKARAHLVGDLKAARLVIEEGATFVGKSEVTTNKATLSATGASKGGASGGNPGQPAAASGGSTPAKDEGARGGTAAEEEHNGGSRSGEKLATFGR